MGPISEMDMVSGVIWEKIHRVVGALPNIVTLYSNEEDNLN